MKPFKIIDSLFVVFLFSGFIGVATGVYPLAIAGGITALSMLTQHQGVALYTALNLTELTTNLGDYCRENRNILISKLLLNQDFGEKFTVLDDVTDEVPLPNLVLTDLIKPANPVTFQPTSDAIVFGSRTLKVRGVKVDLVIIPQLLEKTWHGKMKSPSDPFDMPFEAFIMDYIMQKAKENLHLSALFKGVYNASGTTPASTLTGFLPNIAAEIVAEKHVPTDVGTIDANNIIEKLEQVYDTLDEAQKAVPTEMKVSPQFFDWYVRRYRGLYGGNMDYSGVAIGSVPLDGTLCQVKREPGMAGTTRVLCAQKENFYMGTDTITGYTLNIERDKRTLAVMIDFKAGVEFANVSNGVLAVNKIATDPS
jgi:hypothetical protein